MKKALHIILVAVGVLLFAACEGGSFEFNTYDELILGNWAMTDCYYTFPDSTREDVGPDNLMYTYFKDGTVVATDPEGFQYRGTYRLKNNLIFVTMNDETIMYNIDKLNISQLVLIYINGFADDPDAYTQTLEFEKI